MIKYLKQIDIDKAKWDNCIENAGNSLIYAYSWYLDIVSPKWDALVLGDYEAVMPLPWKKKVGIKYLAQPILSQQLGWFGKNSDKILGSVEIIKKKFFFGFVNFNFSNSDTQRKYREKLNYVLSLKNEYSVIAKSFSSNHKRNIKKAKKAKLFVRNISLDEFIIFYKESNWKYKFAFKESHFKILLSLIQESLHRKSGKLKGVINTNNDILAACFLPITPKRITFLFPVTSNVGYSLNAQFFLVDYLLNKYAERNIVLDFEGSSIEGIAKFYRGFGAVEEVYYTFNFKKLIG